MTTALFLGRFQPPHVGHLLTIQSLATKYDQLIVGVTECEPSVMTIDNVIGIFKSLLPSNNISFLHVSGSVEGGTAIINCQFDVCCSGNPAVLSIMGGKGYKTEYTERSFDSIYSGTHERKTYIENAINKSLCAGITEIKKFCLVNVLNLRPIEKIHPCHYAGVEKQLVDSGVMLKPLIVDNLTLAVLDGSHRYAFLLKHGYKYAPVLLCDYDDESIFVGNHLGHRFEFNTQKWITKKHVRATAISGQLYEPRTTRHFFPFRKIDIPTELKLLQITSERSIDHLLIDVTRDQEIKINNQYIDEIQYELQILKSYVNEQTTVISWLKEQNSFINSDKC